MARQTLQLENGQGQEQTLYQRGYADGKQAREQMFNIISH